MCVYVHVYVYNTKKAVAYGHKSGSSNFLVAWK